MDANKYICKAKGIYEGLWRIGYYVYDFKTNTHYIMSNEIICGNAGSKPTRMDFSLSTYIFNAELYALGEFKADEFFYAGNIFDNPELFGTGGRDGEEN